jgi:hypothetical protein
MARLVFRLLLTIVAGGLISAFLVRSSPGYGSVEEDLDKE